MKLYEMLHNFKFNGFVWAVNLPTNFLPKTTNLVDIGNCGR